jgi:hypothetical protein
MINWISLTIGFFVSIICSLLMWTIQMEESIVHETNFRESMKMLVVSDVTNNEPNIALKDDDL